MVGSAGSGRAALAGLTVASLFMWVLVGFPRSRFASPDLAFLANQEYLRFALLVQLVFVLAAGCLLAPERAKAALRRPWPGIGLAAVGLALEDAGPLHLDFVLVLLGMTQAFSALFEAQAFAPRTAPAPGRPPSWVSAVLFALSFLACVAWFATFPVANDPRMYGQAGGGWVYVAYVPLRVAVTLYITWFLIGAGDLVLAVRGPRRMGLTRLLMGFFTGSALFHLLMLGLGGLGLYYRWLLAALVAGVLVASYPALVELLAHLRDLAVRLHGRPLRERLGPSLLLAAILYALGLLISAKGLFPNAGGDFGDHYLPYYDTVLASHGTELNDVWYHHYCTRGAGAIFLALALTDRLGAQLASSSFVLALMGLLYWLTARPAKDWRWGAVAVVTLVSGLIWTMDNGGYGAFEKQHVITMSLLVALVWAAARLEAGRRRGDWALLASLVAVNLVVFVSTSLPLVLGFLGLLWLRAAFQRRGEVVRAYTLVGGLAAGTLLLLMVSNYVRTGMADVTPFRLFWRFADQQRLSEWVSPYLMVLLELGSSPNMGAIHPIEVNDLARYWIDTLRLWKLVGLCGHPVVLLGLFAGFVWRSRSAPALQESRRVATCIGALIATAILLSFAANQPGSMSRFYVFLFPLMIVLTVLSWKATLGLLPAQARGLPFLLACLTLFLGRAATPPRNAELYRKFAMGRLSCEEAHLSQGAWPEARTLAELPNPPRRVWRLSLLNANLAPSPRSLGMFSYALGNEWHVAIFEPADRAKAVYLKHGVDHFWVDLRGHMFDVAQFSPLLSPDTIGDNLGVVWHEGSRWLLSFRGRAGVEPLPPEFYEGYRKAASDDRLADMEGIYKRLRRIYLANRGKPYPLQREANLPPVRGWQ